MSTYFQPEIITYLDTGSALLNQTLGGGWAEGRMANVVGDSSTGKTLLAEEACGQHLIRYPEGKIYYVEPEASLSGQYLQELGLPMDKINFRRYRTVEGYHDHLNRVLTETTPKDHTLYIVDSLDSLSDAAELDRDIEQGSFKVNKPKILSETWRRLIQEAERKNVTQLVISQTRTKIGVTFPVKYRSGGDALQFYSSQVIWISQKDVIKQKRQGIERAVGIEIKVKCTKNKTGRPLRECGLNIMFERGIDDITSNLQFLKDTDSLESVPTINNVKCTKDNLTVFGRKLWDSSAEVFNQYRKEIADITVAKWLEVEKLFDPPKNRKYSWGNTPPSEGPNNVTTN